MSPVLTSEGTYMMCASGPYYYDGTRRENLISLAIFRPFAEELH